MTRCVLLPLVAVLIASCSSSRQEQSAAETSEKEKAMVHEGQRIPPNHCRVVGTVVAVKPDLKGSGANDPCGKAPCIATVKIDSVLGYGSAFGSSLGSGKEIEVRFTHTLSPTKEVLPEINPPLPGLAVGSQFQADVRASAVMGAPQVVFSVDGYTKR